MITIKIEEAEEEHDVEKIQKNHNARWKNNPADGVRRHLFRSVSDWSLTRAIFIYLTRVEVNGNLFWRPKLHKGDYVFVFGDKDFGRFS